jgi:hydrogenase maturation factor
MTMNEQSTREERLPTLGKITPEFFEQIILPRLGRKDDSVVVGPQHGVDIGVVRLGDGKVMAMTTDPFFVVPDYGWERAGWFAVHILASDITTSGLRPQYMSIDLNLPPAMTESDLEALWKTVHETCLELGINVVTGHTGRYEGCNYPMIGGCTLVSVGDEASYVAGGMSKPGDAVLITKGAAIEATGLMAVTFPDKIQAALGEEVATRAQEVFWQMSTVKDSMTAVSVGVRDRGVTAMHDATECGVLGGLFELAVASGIGMRINQDSIPISEDVRAICDLFSMDPYTSISEGTLLLTCMAAFAEPVLSALRHAGIVAEQIGECNEGTKVELQRNGKWMTLSHPRVDPFWQAFAKAAGGGA